MFSRVLRGLRGVKGGKGLQRGFWVLKGFKGFKGVLRSLGCRVSGNYGWA